MSGAGPVLRAAMADALRADAMLAATLNGVFDGPAVRASPPFAEIAETLGTDWSTKDARGREVRLAVLLRDETETSARLATLAEAVELAVLAMPRTIPGWHVASLVFVRSRIAGEGPGRWIASVEFRARVLEV
ncbi:MAG: DUF3168 domain-containing protein [Pseudomonadota bacterium]